MKLFESKDPVRSSETFLVEKEEIFSELEEKRGSLLFLGKYSMTEVKAVLSKKNFFKEAQKRHLWPLEFEMDSSEFPPLQRLQIFYQSRTLENLIADLKIREGRFKPKNRLAVEFGLPEFRFVILEWLTMQNPLLSFSEDKSPLPGQKHPGLSLGKKVLDLFDYLVRLDRTDGLMAFPAYFHNALLFSRAFKFLNPVKTGEVTAIAKSFPEVSFKQLAWIVYLNCLRDKEGRWYEWKAEEQVHSHNKKLKEYFGSEKYKNIVREIQDRVSFTIDWKRFAQKCEEQDLCI